MAYMHVYAMLTAIVPHCNDMAAIKRGNRAACGIPTSQLLPHPARSFATSATEVRLATLYNVLLVVIA
jgi:hypothetical protein